jgi:tetratricopeptide (TPR) repeat protein
MRYAIISLIMVTAVSVSATTRAEDQPDEAMAFFKKGIDLFNAEKYEDAASAFRRAYELKPNWKLNYNIGQSEAAAKRLGLALQAFEAYLSQGGDDISTERRDRDGGTKCPFGKRA